jgi:fatty acid desaturase
LLAHLQATLVGRLAFGPIVAMAALAHEEIGRVRQAPAAVLRDWLPHLAAVAVIAGWLEWTGFGVVRYLLLVVYPGTALTLLRSFAEHRADLPDGARAATVERGGLLGLLFLNNNLHAAHHERPDLAWFRLPAYQRDHRQRLSVEPARTYRHYGEIVRRFAFRPHHVLVHPGEEARS